MSPPGRIVGLLSVPGYRAPGIEVKEGSLSPRIKSHSFGMISLKKSCLYFFSITSRGNFSFLRW